MLSENDKNDEKLQAQQEMEIRDGARVTPGGSNAGNAESEPTGDKINAESNTEGIEQDGSVKNSK